MACPAARRTPNLWHARHGLTRRARRRAAPRLGGRFAGTIEDDAQVVLLGSVASGKYLDILLPVFGDRLRFPAIFAGLGDMSRGGLLLRAARADRELEYTSLTAPRHKSLAGDPVELARAWARSVSAPMNTKKG